MLRGKCIALNAYMKKIEKSRIGNVIFYSNQLEEEIKSQLSKKKEIIKNKSQ